MQHVRPFAMCMSMVLAQAGWWPGVAIAQPLPADDARPLSDLSLEELSDIVVTSVSRRDQSLLQAAASVYIISGDEVRRLGITTLPEALRLAPNLLVAAIDARQYAISARGFNSNIANKLLVLVDGRTIYSPLFSGVFWDAQDFVPANIDRIEVISGAAGATWGTNAVNGVINVVTKSALTTPGSAGSLTIDSQGRTAAASHGIPFGNGLAVRAHVRAFKRDTSRLRSSRDMGDASSGTSAGLRADWASSNDTLMLSAGVYEGGSDARQGVRPDASPVDLRGANLSVHWTRRLSDDSNFDVQAYVDRTRRSDNFLLQDNADIYDLEAKYRQTVGKHRWLTGIGLRHAKDSAAPGLLFAFLPARKRQRWASVFAQDEIDLTDRLALTLGMRLERNPYTGWEVLPNARIGYSPDTDTLFWAAVSRAVRSPSRFDREIFIPYPAPFSATTPFFLAGGPNVESEIARVAELGYRTQLGPRASLSVTGFLHDYDRLRSSERLAQPGFPAFSYGNLIKGQIRGLEAWGQWQPTPHWRLDGGLLWLDEDLRVKTGSTDARGPLDLGNDPNSQVSLRSNHVLGDGLDLAVAIRRVGRLPDPLKAIQAYTATDVVLNWSLRKNIRITAGVRDLFDRGHEEYQGFNSTSEIPRSGFLAVSFELP